MTKGLISIIVPVYNSEKFLENLFISIEKQEYKNIELIFVNDGSTDNSLKLLNDFKNKHHNTTLINNNNQGVSISRNIGLSKANGEYIYFLDSDDMLHPKALKILYNEIIKNNADASKCLFKKVKEDKNYNSLKQTNVTSKNLIVEGKDNILSHILSSGKFVYACWANLYKHNIIKQIPGYPKVFIENCKFAEDIAFNAQYYRLTNKIVLNFSRLYYYRLRKGSSMHKIDDKLTVNYSWKYYDFIDKNDEYKESKIYLKILKCIENQWCLFYCAKDPNCSKETVKKLYLDYKENIKFCKKGKKSPFYIRKLLKYGRPYLYFINRKKLKD